VGAAKPVWNAMRYQFPPAVTVAGLATGGSRPLLPRFGVAQVPLRLFSVSGSITPRRNRVTWPVLEEMTMEMHCVATEIAAAAAWREPSPPGSA
jgi:hypothetical protein